MIESCTRRRMIISVVGLGLLTLLILVLEEALTAGPINQAPTPYSTSNSSSNQSLGKISVEPKLVGPSPHPQTQPESAKGKCWLQEDFDVVQECAPCTKFEINSQSPAACTETGLKEKVSCKKSGITFRSCATVKGIEKQNFLVFMFSMLLLFVLSFGAVKFRTSQLERKTIKNIERRLAAGQ